MRVAIGIPSGDMVHTDFALSLAKLIGFQAARSSTQIAVINAKSSLVQRGRNLLVLDAYKCQASHILFLDSDMVFPPAILRDLLAHNKDIVGCDYMKRRPPFKATARDREGQPFPYAKKGLHEASRLAGGAMLVKMKVFESMPVPWFDADWDKIDADFTGEDYHFCDRARNAGFKIYCDLDITVGHIGDTIYTRQVFARKEELESEKQTV